MKNGHAHIAMPEWIHRNDRGPVSWTILPGPLQRGEAFTDLARCTMRVPTGGDATSRCVRAHELMHAKVSPLTLWRPEDYTDLTDDVLVTAEEFRVNQLLREVGFPVERYLADGSETRSGERIGSNGDWNAAVLILVATSGTKASRGVSTGLRRTRPEWSMRLRTIDRDLKKLWSRARKDGLAEVASTVAWGEATRGWRFTLELARFVQGHLTVEFGGDSFPADRIPSATGSRGKFARPVLADTLLVQRLSGGVRGTRLPSASGRHPRRIERLFTDPERRIFDRRIRSAGGVILVDQSGSMRLTDEDVWKMIRAAPGCTVIGYSHEARSTSIPNIWILARNGRVVKRVPRGNGGNGVDGPALRLAASLRTGREPLIWVCDGFVTDAYDDHSDELTRECSELVSRHRVHQVPDVQSAIAALSRASKGAHLPMRAIGPVASARVRSHADVDESAATKFSLRFRDAP